MVNLHYTAISFLRRLQSLNIVHASVKDFGLVRDESMSPTLKHGDVIEVDAGAPVRNGALIAIATDDFVEVRELLIQHGEFFLLAHNRRYPTVSMGDYRDLNPGAFIAGVVCQKRKRCQ